MDKLDNHLNPHTKQPYHPAIKAAMKLARKKINRYYSLTDLLSVYHIAMGNEPVPLSIMLRWLRPSVLHPGLKLEYFRQQGWEEEWVDNAETLTCKEYIAHYDGKENVVTLAPDAANSVSVMLYLTVA